MTAPQHREADVLVIGGGLVGAAIAFGLCGRGMRVAMLDEGDIAHRASRGNFALVWVQSKGYGLSEYARWTKASSDLWPGFAAELEEESGIALAYERPGGFTLCLSEEEFIARSDWLRRFDNQHDMIALGTRMMERTEVERHLPDIGPEVVGASFCPLDGHVGSLQLFRALHLCLAKRGVIYAPGGPVEAVAPLPNGGFAARRGAEEWRARRLVLAAGLGNARLAPMLGLAAPVRPQRGQILVTARTEKFLDYPTVSIRQTAEGSVMLGDSQEEVGFDEGQDLDVMATIARRAVRSFPRLAKLPIVRAWSALRVMTPDGFPIYAQSRDFPGAFLATCHSGVTLAAAHARSIAAGIASGILPEETRAFSPARFDRVEAA